VTGRVEGKVALVTGAESAAGGVVGLARASALMLAREGAKVVATDIVPKEQDSVVDEIRSLGGEAIFVCHDVALESGWQNSIAAALEAFGKLDVLVNMAVRSRSTAVSRTRPSRTGAGTWRSIWTGSSSAPNTASRR
jgi:NAD(P)-dependent dehydrogenase (short-subunit alcohol dehydrogenase family)